MQSKHLDFFFSNNAFADRRSLRRRFALFADRLIFCCFGLNFFFDCLLAPVCLRSLFFRSWADTACSNISESNSICFCCGLRIFDFADRVLYFGAFVMMLNFISWKALENPILCAFSSTILRQSSLSKFVMDRIGTTPLLFMKKKKEVRSPEYPNMCNHVLYNSVIDRFF